MVKEGASRLDTSGGRTSHFIFHPALSSVACQLAHILVAFDLSRCCRLPHLCHTHIVTFTLEPSTGCRDPAARQLDLTSVQSRCVSFLRPFHTTSTYLHLPTCTSSYIGLACPIFAYRPPPARSPTPATLIDDEFELQKHDCAHHILSNWTHFLS